MTILTTERMLLRPLSRAIVALRLQNESFDLEFGDDLTPPVHFAREWPGDLLAVFPGLMATLRHGAEVDGSFVAIDRESATAIGAIGAKGTPHAGTVVEIGYGFVPDQWGHGYATEAVGALVEHLFDVGVVRVSAQTALANRASERVLEKNAFVRVGTNWEQEDGDLIVWERKGRS